MKKLMYRQIKFLLLFIFMLLFTVSFSYGFFDTLSKSKSGSINIGDWWNITPSNIIEYIISKYPGDLVKQDYILKQIGLDDDKLDEIYKDYSMLEMEETINLIDNFTNNFLDYSKGAANYKNTIPQFVELANLTPFSPGDVKFFKQVIQTAEFANNIYYTPVTFELTLSSDEGIDLTDFSVEVLYDSSPFTQNNPFNYAYKLNDLARNYYKTIIQKEVAAALLNDNQKIDAINFVNKIYNNQTKTNDFYLHNYNSPLSSGEWKRFIDGPNLYFDSPKTGSTWSGEMQQFNFDNDQSKNIGLKILGRNDGKTIELLFHLEARKPRTFEEAKILPIMIVVSRGKKVDQNNNLLNQKTDFIKPKICFRAFKGNIYQQGI